MMRRQFRRLVFAGLRYSGLPLLARELCQRRKVTVVVYHDIAAQTAEAHFRALKARYNVISLRQYVNARKTSTYHKLPPKALVITLDDGHKSNWDLLPLLKNLKIPVTIFVCSGVVGTNRGFWWQGQDLRQVGRLKQISNEERKKWLVERDFNDTADYADRQALSGAEIEEMKPWIDFQSHTVFHPVLPSCSDEEAAAEIAQSRAELERAYNLLIDALAYPNGDYSTREVHLARECGYACALSLDVGSNDDTTDLYRLRRTPLLDDGSVSEILVKASGLWEIVRLGRKALARLFHRGVFHDCGSTERTRPVREFASSEM